MIRKIKQAFSHKAPASQVAELEQCFFLLLKDKFDYSGRDYLMDESLDADQLAAFKNDLEKLLAGTPVQHLIGYTLFCDLKIRVDNRVLIPRPETEELVSICLERKKNAKRAIDLATGSACIALALKQKVAEVFALEKSEAALSLARENARLNDLSLHFIQDDILEPQEVWPQDLDLIVSNPPYIRDLEKSEMENKVLQHEPEMALFVTNDNPLVFYEAITKYAHQALSQEGLLAFEINQYLGEEMKTLLDQYFLETEILNDSFGNARFALAHKKRPTK